MAQRQQETAQANQILQLHWRHNLGLPDSGLSDCPEMRRALVEQLRVVRPGVVIAPWTPCRHPDHQALHQLARSVCFFAGAGGYDTGQPPWRPQRLIHHLEYEDVKPSFVIDISDQFADRERAIDCYSTQFFTGTAAGTTVVGSRLFRHRMVSRCAYYGALIGCEYGEPYITTETLRIDDPLAGLQVN